MEGMVLIGIILLIGAILGWVNFFQMRQLKNQVSDLRQQLKYLGLKNTQNSQPLPKEQPPTRTENVSETIIVQEQATHPETKSDSKGETSEEFSPENTAIPKRQSDPGKPSKFDDYIALSHDNWMVLVGGISVALAGIFLARYAIQHGVLGPTGRIISGILTGLALHAAAEYFRRKKTDYHPSFAMLAAGGSITLFATLLAALHMYQMFSPTVTFVLLAIVAILTSWLALVHGAFLAAMGMIGAYIVPILVSTGSGKILIALTYSLIISISLLVLMRHVFRYWLWLGLVAGSLLWWLISFDYGVADPWRPWYLTILVYCLLSIRNSNWSLAQISSIGDNSMPISFIKSGWNQIEKLLPATLVLMILAYGLSIYQADVIELSVFQWLPFTALVLYTGRANEHLISHGWLLLFTILSVVFLKQVSLDHQFIISVINTGSIEQLVYMLMITAAVFTGLSILNARVSQFVSWWSSLAILAPLLILILCYVITDTSSLTTTWAGIAVIVGALYMFLATTSIKQQWHKGWTIWLFLAAHFAYSFTAVILFENGTLTLALAIQAISVVLITKRFDVQDLGWLLKAIITLTVARLTINPWLADYPTTEHWTLWTYGGSLVSFIITSRLLPDSDRLKCWVETAVIHVLVLTIWVESRYFIYDGVVFAMDFEFAEAALNNLIFGGLALVYYYRAQISHSMQMVYSIYCRILMALAIINYMVIILQTLQSGPWVTDSISSTPIFNIMILAYGLSPLLLWLATRLVTPDLKKYLVIPSAVLAFIFINLEIRHLWHGILDLNMRVPDGELYTYSAVWLVMALSAIFLASYRFGKQVYKGGMLLLVLVIGKVFLIDMSQLDGIYRIVAFMGLGLSLLGLAYIHKRLQSKLEAVEQSA